MFLTQDLRYLSPTFSSQTSDRYQRCRTKWKSTRSTGCLPPLIRHPSFKRNQTDSPFLRLPTELRLKICGLALGDEATLHLGSDNSVRRVGMHLPRTCRQLNMDCASFLETYTTITIT